MINHETEIRKLFAQSKNIALMGHINPDGDCIGSLLGLGRILEKQGKRVSYFTPTPPSKIFNFLPDIKKIKTKFDYKDYDILVFVDLTSYQRVSPFADHRKKYFDDHTIIVFDHHLDTAVEHALVIKDTKIMSCAELIFEKAKKRRKKDIDKNVATYFYLGLTMDSGNFVFDQDHERIFTNALELIKMGADKTSIIDNIFRRKSLSSIRFLRVLLNRIQVKDDILYTYYADKELKKYHIDQEEAGYGITIIQNIDGPKLTLTLRLIDNMIKVSLRSKMDGHKFIDCREIANHFGGGGHLLASGFSIPAKGDFQKQRASIVQTINKIIKKRK